MVKKIKPKAAIKWNNGNDGRDGFDEIVYYCPTCRRQISYYMSDTACDECGTFYDWGKHKPYLKTYKQIVWE